MSETDPERLNELDARLKAARERISGPTDPAMQNAPGDSKLAGVGMRMSLELVVGIVFGLGLGWVLDHWLGTKPWFMIILMFLGLGAGISNVMRTARNLYRDADK
jgi:ATP synthase protein I